MSLDRYGVKPETVQAVGTFSILWCQFEQTFFEKSAYPNKIVKWAKANEPDEAVLALCRKVRDEACAVLQLDGDAGYDDAGELVYGEQYTGADKHQNLVIEFLLDEENGQWFGGCLLFAHRVRTALFRSTKEIRALNGRQNLFCALNAVLDTCLLAKGC